MTRAVLDHLVVGAERLEDGVRHVTDALGLEPVPGGRHDYLATHNALMRLGDATYLEVIATDPDAGPPEAPRWFDLDGEATRAALAVRPRLLAWVARCDDLDAATAAAPWSTGPVRRMRRGTMTWRIAFPADGRLIEGGILPPLIEWDGDAVHPADKLPEAGADLVSLRAYHPHPDKIREELAAIGLDHAIETMSNEDIRLEAVINTPDGRRRLT